MHYEAVNLMRKPKTTRNPHYPRGTRRRWQLYSENASIGKQLSPSEIDAASFIGNSYWAHTRPKSLLPRPWEIDPILSSTARRAREIYMEEGEFESLKEKYIAFREFTLDLSSMGL